MKRQLHPKRIQSMRTKARIRAAMRLHPTQIIIGEVRGDETVDFLKSINTGAVKFA